MMPSITVLSLDDPDRYRPMNSIVRIVILDFQAMYHHFVRVKSRSLTAGDDIFFASRRSMAKMTMLKPAVFRSSKHV